MLAKFLSVTASGLAFVAAAEPSVAAQSNCARTYTVAANDTCDVIGAAQHVSSFQLAFVNTQINAGCTNIFPGEVLCLGITGQDCTTTAVVNSGDTCPSIEAAARINDTVLKANNPNINADCSNIRVGEVLCTAFQIFNYTVTA